MSSNALPQQRATLSSDVIERMAEGLWTYEKHDGEWVHYAGGPVGDRLRSQAIVLLRYALDEQDNHA